ncbi:TPA: LysM-like peptidoglycan-binding domain-containing protein [Photobacterium damselae]
MGQANRRLSRKNRTKRDTKDMNALKQRLLDGIAPLTVGWQKLPTFHRRAVTVVGVLMIGAFFLPTSNDLQSDLNDGSSDGRREISLDLGGVVTQPETSTTSSTSDGDKQGTIKLDISATINRALDDKTPDDKASGAAKAVKDPNQPHPTGGMVDNGPRPELKPYPSKIYPLDGSAPYMEKVKNAAAQEAKIQASAGPWRSYTVQSGETLANIFRKLSLNDRDAFLMAKVEGSDKPISRIHRGQVLRFRTNSSGEVTDLQITDDGRTVSFALQPTGSYRRH